MEQASAPSEDKLYLVYSIVDLYCHPTQHDKGIGEPFIRYADARACTGNHKPTIVSTKTHLSGKLKLDGTCPHNVNPNLTHEKVVVVKKNSLLHRVWYVPELFQRIMDFVALNSWMDCYNLMLGLQVRSYFWLLFRERQIYDNVVVMPELLTRKVGALLIGSSCGETTWKNMGKFKKPGDPRSTVSMHNPAGDAGWFPTSVKYAQTPAMCTPDRYPLPRTTLLHLVSDQEDMHMHFFEATACWLRSRWLPHVLRREEDKFRSISLSWINHFLPPKSDTAERWDFHWRTFLKAAFPLWMDVRNKMCCPYVSKKTKRPYCSQVSAEMISLTYQRPFLYHSSTLRYKIPFFDSFIGRHTMSVGMIYSSYYLKAYPTPNQPHFLGHVMFRCIDCFIHLPNAHAIHARHLRMLYDTINLQTDAINVWEAKKHSDARENGGVICFSCLNQRRKLLDRTSAWGYLFNKLMEPEMRFITFDRHDGFFLPHMPLIPHSTLTHQGRTEYMHESSNVNKATMHLAHIPFNRGPETVFADRSEHYQSYLKACHVHDLMMMSPKIVGPTYDVWGEAINVRMSMTGVPHWNPPADSDPVSREPYNPKNWYVSSQSGRFSRLGNYIPPPNTLCADGINAGLYVEMEAKLKNVGTTEGLVPLNMKAWLLKLLLYAPTNAMCAPVGWYKCKTVYEAVCDRFKAHSVTDLYPNIAHHEFMLSNPTWDNNISMKPHNIPHSPKNEYHYGNTDRGCRFLHHLPNSDATYGRSSGLNSLCKTGCLTAIGFEHSGKEHSILMYPTPIVSSWKALTLHNVLLKKRANPASVHTKVYDAYEKTRHDFIRSRVTAEPSSRVNIYTPGSSSMEQWEMPLFEFCFQEDLDAMIETLKKELLKPFANVHDIHNALSNFSDFFDFAPKQGQPFREMPQKYLWFRACPGEVLPNQPFIPVSQQREGDVPFFDGGSKHFVFHAASSNQQIMEMNTLTQRPSLLTQWFGPVHKDVDTDGLLYHWQSYEWFKWGLPMDVPIRYYRATRTVLKDDKMALDPPKAYVQLSIDSMLPRIEFPKKTRAPVKRRRQTPTAANDKKGRKPAKKKVKTIVISSESDSDSSSGTPPLVEKEVEVAKSFEQILQEFMDGQPDPNNVSEEDLTQLHLQWRAKQRAAWKQWKKENN